MFTSKFHSDSKGFTLVEILVVMVVMGVVITSVYSLFISSKKTAVTSEEVVDVQQNLRFALDTLVADIRMAGFLIPADKHAIVSAPDDIGMDTNEDGGLESGAVFSLNTISSSRTYARVVSEAADGSGLTIDSDMTGLFNNGDLIHVIRPGTRADLSGSTGWTLGAITTANLLPIDTGTYAPGSINQGDMVVHKYVGEANEETTIQYWLRHTAGGGGNNYELIRNDGLGAVVIASNIAAFDLRYAMANGSEVDSTTDYENIRAIRLNISAEVDNNKIAVTNGVKRRSLQTLVKIRNPS